MLSKPPFLSPSILSTPSTMIVALLPLSPSAGWQTGERAARLMKSQTPSLLLGSPLRLNIEEQTYRVRTLMGTQAVHLCLAEMLSAMFSILCVRGQHPGGTAGLLRVRLMVNGSVDVCFPRV